MWRYSAAKCVRTTVSIYYLSLILNLKPAGVFFLIVVYLSRSWVSHRWKDCCSDHRSALSLEVLLKGPKGAACPQTQTHKLASSSSSVSTYFLYVKHDKTWLGPGKTASLPHETERGHWIVCFLAVQLISQLSRPYFWLNHFIHGHLHQSTWYTFKIQTKFPQKE